MNILLLSCGTRNKIVQYFKKELQGNGLVIAADCSKLAPALYDADEYIIVPRVSELGYIDTILAICKEHNIGLILSLIDPELSLLAKHKQAFIALGTMPIISDYSIVELCFDKYALYEFLIENGFKTVKSYVEKELFYKEIEAGTIQYPVFVKPRRGSASIDIYKVNARDEIELLFRDNKDLMIQEFMDGVEIGADVYIDMISGESVAIFTKEKIKMRAGETDKSISIKSNALFELIKAFVKRVGFRGVIDIDLFERNGEFYISEVNPRFGGGYPHAYESGVNFPKMIVDNRRGIVNADRIGLYEDGSYMMKYCEVKMISKFEQ